MFQKPSHKGKVSPVNASNTGRRSNMNLTQTTPYNTKRREPPMSCFMKPTSRKLEWKVIKK